MKKSGKWLGGMRIILSVMACNWSTLICFELLYKVVGIGFFFPFFGELASFMPGLIGEKYLSEGNIVKVLSHPTAVLILLCAVLLLGAYLFFEIIALTIYSEKNWNREELTVRSLLWMSFKKTLGMFRLKRAAAFLMLPLLPLSFFGAASAFLRTVRIPEFIMTAIVENAWYVCLLAVVLLLVNYLFFLYLLGLPALLLTESSFLDSWKESRKLLEGKKLVTITQILSYPLAFAVVLGIIWMAGGSILGGTARMFYGLEKGRRLFSLQFDTYTGVCNLTSGAFISAFFCTMAIILYHRYKGEDRPDRVKRAWSVRRVAVRTAVIGSMICSLILMADTEFGRQFLFFPHSDVSVVAHRGGTVFGPENTVAALNQAIEDKADMAEIDVQQLKDGMLVVLHDTNFQRTTGVNLNVWDAEYDQVKEMDAGSYHSPQYAGEPVPTLEEMLRAAKGKIDLMIELKATGREKSLVEDTLALIKTYGMEEQCTVASLDFELLKQAKALNPDIRATYISILLVSGQYDVDQVDCYSVETTFLSRALVYQAHAQGKKVYGWTASTEDSIRKVMYCEVDGIVTDNPPLVQYYLDTFEDNYLKEAVADVFFSGRK